jgi:rhodanese-related sulfurtransferase/CBS domain-containing protein
MPVKVDRDEVRRLVEDGAQLIEVLPRKEYEEAHLPGALNIPLDELTPQAAAQLDRSSALITYCYDSQCDMSPRAAWRLESLGFASVYHYAPGKADWMGAGLRVEGQAASLKMIGTLARRDVPTCGLESREADVRRDLETADWDSCFVVNEERIVLGRVYLSRLEDAGTRTVADVMDPGPSTFRPDVTAVEMAHRMHEAELETAPVTDSGGRLIGLVFREDVEEAAEPTGETELTRDNPAARE